MGFLYFKDRDEWLAWLEKNHKRSPGITILFYKKHARKIGLSYIEALEEAIAYGWIDSKLRRIDHEKHTINFTPRKTGSVWSKLNKDRAEKLINEGRMNAAGYASIEEAKKTGAWDAAYTNKKKERMPSDLKKQLMKNEKAWKNFCGFANSYRNMYIGWVAGAKTEATRKKRITEVAKRSLINKKPGM